MVLTELGRASTPSLLPPDHPIPTVPAPLTRRFRILRHLGSGAEGSVYLAEDRNPGGGRLSLKVLRRPARKSLPTLRMRLSALARIDHPNIARILDFDVAEDRACLWIAREYVAGEELTRFSARDGKDRWSLVPRLLEGVARALLQFHDRDLAHGDLRPANILCSRTPEGPMLKLIDGGISLPSQEIPSQQLLHLRRQDLRSVGASFYSALTGKTPDRRTEPRRWTPGIPRWINRLILRLLVPYSPDGVGTAELFLEEVLRQSRTPLRGRRLEITLSKPPVIGRDRELAVLREGIDHSSSGRRSPRVLLLGGEAGSGKSALLREAQVYARARGIHFISARAPAGDGLPYEPIFQVAQSLAALHGWPDALASRPSRTPGELARALSRLLGRAAERGPCVIALDDAQAISLDAADIVGATVEALRSAPVLFLIAVRGAERTRRWSEALRVPPLLLGELDPDASASIVRLALGLPPDDALVRRLHVLTGGNPGRLLTSLEMLRPQLRKEGAAVGVASLDTLPIPRDAEAAAATLASRLEPRLLKAAKALSAHPGFLRDSICHDVLGPTDEGDLLVALSSHGVLRRVSLHTYEWASTALRHELYSRLGGEARRRLHARFARAGRFWMRPGILTTQLYQSYHLARTEQPERAQGHALAAARLLAGVFRYGEAADYYELALRLRADGSEARSVAILRSLQSACRKGGLHRRGKRVSLELLRRRTSQAQYAAAAYFVAKVDGASAAISFIDGALRSRCRRSACGLALLHSKRALALATVGRTTTALRSARRAEVYLSECKVPATAADVHIDLGSVHFTRGNLAQASDYYQEALRLARRARDASREAALCDNVALALRGQLRHPAALRYARRGLAIKLRRGLQYDSAITRMVLGVLLDDTGDHQAGTAEMLRARETFRARGDMLRQAWATYSIGAFHLALEQHPEAMEWFERTLEEAPKDLRNGLALAAHAGMIQTFVSTGDLEKAHAALRAGSLYLHPGVAFEPRFVWSRARALLSLASGRLAHARGLLREARRRLARSEAQIYSLQCRLIGLLADLSEGSSPEIAQRADALTSIFEAAGLRSFLCESQLLGAEASAKGGDLRRARQRLARVAPLVEQRPQPSFRIRRDLLRSRLAVSHAQQIRAALDAYRLATKHELWPLVHLAALQLARSYEAREDYSSALKYYQEARAYAGHRSA
jgi:tetratricopeptide (TPR) repeat protein